MPTLRRMVTKSALRPIISSPSSSTEPSTLQIEIRSFIRFKHRNKVDLPQPDGPIRAVTELRLNGMDTL